jgi:hypothetical protein
MRISDGMGSYKLKITKRILETYLKKLDLSAESLDRVNMRLFILRVIKDFLDQKLSTDNLTFITTQIFYEIKSPAWFDYDNELFNVLSETTEASWYFWRDKDKYQELITTLKKYYEEQSK